MTDKTEAQPEALRLAEWCEENASGIYRPSAQAAAELRRLHAEIQQLKAERATQTNRAAAAEQQVIALTQRLDMANRLNTDARNELAQLSALQAAPDGWHAPGLGEVHNADHTKMIYCADGDGVVDDALANAVLNALLSAAPPPPEREPKCWCETCRPITLSDMRMVLCPDCGNKRCPKANHHDNACTNSNAPGQPGSSWEHVKPHGATND